MKKILYETLFKKLIWYEKILFLLFKEYSQKIYVAGMRYQFEFDNIY